LEKTAGSQPSERPAVTHFLDSAGKMRYELRKETLLNFFPNIKRMKKGVKYAIITLILILGVIIIFNNQNKEDNIAPEIETEEADQQGKALEIQESPQEESSQESSESMTFLVSVPENTLEGDTVYIYTHTQQKFKMNKTSPFEYEITLTQNQLQLHEEGMIQYRYSRNGYDFHTAEYLEPDTNDYFWTKKGRTVSFENGKIQQDTIRRWRFFPEEGMITKKTGLQPQGDFLPRINNIPFRSGQTIEDLYVDAFHEFFDSTAEHMKDQGYNWVEIDPPWQWIEVNGLPKVRNEIKNNPNYPNDEMFLEEVRAYKKQGLSVYIAPQACCTPLNMENRTQEWWQAYFTETERFLVHFAELAQEADADAFSYAVTEWDDEKIPLDVEQEWRTIFKSIKKVFDGEVGQMVWILGPEVSAEPSLIPDMKSLTWADELDFIMVHSDFPLSEKENPTDEELKHGADAVVDGTRIIYDTFAIPVLIRNGYFNVKYSWKGQTFYSISSIPWISDPESKLKESVYEFDTEDHARVVNAYFKAIAEKPWVIGYLHFGYTHWEDPLSPWMSVRGKPAEDIWNRWNMKIYKK